MREKSARRIRHSVAAGILVVCAAAACANAVRVQAQKKDAPTPAREELAPVQGARLWFKDTGGSGVPVVFLHAATGSTLSWDHQIPAFTTAGYRFITFDRRGTGRTVVDAEGTHSSAADDLQALMDYLHIDRFHLVGTAAGGFTALDYALSYQQHLRSLVVVNSIGAIQDADYVAMVGRLRPPQWEQLPIEFQELGPSFRVADPDGTKRWLEIQHTSHAAGPAVRQPMKNKATFTALESLHVPTLLMTGDADLIAPPPLLKLFSAHIKSSQTAVIPEAGHSSYWEQPEAFNKAVLEFIRKH